MNEEVERLLLEAQRAKFTERRTEARHPFVRPVRIHVGGNPGRLAFSKDMSKLGIGVITDLEMADGTIAVLSIHSTSLYPAHMTCELRWSEKFGKGWYLTGWKFMSAASPPQNTDSSG